MKRYGTLYLFPSTLGESGIARVIPTYNLEIIRSLRYFIVEEIRAARRFLKKACPEINIADLFFLLNNEHSKEQDLVISLEPLLNGNDMGLLPDAGIPCVADPGAAMVKLAREHGIRVVPLAGPSSLMLALMASGFNGQHFVFHGYLPVDRKERMLKIRKIERDVYAYGQTQIFIEAPYRNIPMFESLKQTCDGQTLLCIATDLTLESENIEVHPISVWKGKKPDIHKKPTVFLLFK